MGRVVSSDFAITGFLAQGVDKKTTPQVKNVVIAEGVVTPIYLRPGYTTSVRLPEEVNSVVVGNPLAFKAEHSETEPHALITTKSSQEIDLHLISSGLAGASSQVDFLVEFNRLQSLLVGKTATSSLFVLETKSIGSPPSAQYQPVREAADPVAAALATQKAIAAPFWQGSSLQVSVGESSEVDHQMLLGFSLLNNSRQAIELLPPQIVLNGPSASGKGKEIKAEPIAITDYRVTKKRLGPGNAPIAF